MKNLHSISLIFLIVFGSQAQSSNLTGVWHGTSTYLKEHTQLRYELIQEGNVISGFVFTKSQNGKDSTKAVINGKVENNSVELKGIEYVYKVGLACLAIADLEYKLLGKQESLIGKWKGDLSLNTCPPVVGGVISVVKELPEQMVTKTSESSNSPKQPGDAVELAMVNELSKRKFYALIIGINEYSDDAINDLENPVQDAKNLANVLIEHYSFDKENVTLLNNAKREDIINALDELTIQVTDKDNLLIFYAGHGIWSEQLNQGYWLPSDATMKSKSFWLSNSTLRDYVGGINSKHTLLISDACFSGGILKERSVYGESRAVLEMYKLPSRKAITSGTLKTVPDKSVFIEYLLKNLSSNTSTLLSADQLFRSFKTAVINNSPNGQVPQYGPISQAGDEGGDFIFLRSN